MSLSYSGGMGILVVQGERICSSTPQFCKYISTTSTSTSVQIFIRNRSPVSFLERQISFQYYI
ncbi:hypothetical protein SCA6_019727 [Theobroma cacao]